MLERQGICSIICICTGLILGLIIGVDLLHLTLITMLLVALSVVRAMKILFLPALDIYFEAPYIGEPTSDADEAQFLKKT